MLVEKTKGPNGPLRVLRCEFNRNLFRLDIHADADAVAGMSVHAGHVLAARVLVGDIVRTDDVFGAIAAIVAFADRVAHRHARRFLLLVALRGLVDTAAGHAADHRTHRSRRIARRTAADLAAERGANDAADHGGDVAPGFGALRISVTVVVAIVTAVVISIVVAVIVAVAAIAVVAGVVAILVSILIPIVAAVVTVFGPAALCGCRRGAIARLQYRIDADHACVIVVRRVAAHGAVVAVCGYVARRLRRSGTGGHRGDEAKRENRSGEAVHGALPSAGAARCEP